MLRDFGILFHFDISASQLFGGRQGHCAAYAARNSRDTTRHDDARATRISTKAKEHAVMPSAKSARLSPFACADMGIQLLEVKCYSCALNRKMRRRRWLPSIDAAQPGKMTATPIRQS